MSVGYPDDPLPGPPDKEFVARWGRYPEDTVRGETRQWWYARGYVNGNRSGYERGWKAAYAQALLDTCECGLKETAQKRAEAMWREAS
jgi:hypothetical protein